MKTKRSIIRKESSFGWTKRLWINKDEIHDIDHIDLQLKKLGFIEVNKPQFIPDHEIIIYLDINGIYEKSFEKDNNWWTRKYGFMEHGVDYDIKDFFRYKHQVFGYQKLLHIKENDDTISYHNSIKNNIPGNVQLIVNGYDSSQPLSQFLGILNIFGS